MRIIMEHISIPVIKEKNRVAFILFIVYEIDGVVVKWGKRIIDEENM